MGRALLGVLSLAALALSVLAAPPAAGAHGGTVRVEGDAGFADAHWTGDGTAANPYRPTFAAITAAGGFGVELSGTTRHVNLSGLTITGGGTSSDGIRLLNVRNVTVWGATLESNRVGVYVRDSVGVLIGASTVKTSQVGIFLDATTSSTVRDNRIQLNERDVEFRQARLNTLVSNNLSVATGQYGLYFDDNASFENSIGTTNIVNSIPVRWYTGLVGTAAAPVVIRDAVVDLPRITNVGQVVVHNSSHVRLEDAVATGGAASGIVVRQSASVELVRPVGEGNAAAGIFVELARATRVSNGSARENVGSGIVVQSSDATHVENTTVADNDLAGVRVVASSNDTTLLRLVVSANAGGLVADSATNVTLTQSTFSNGGASTAVALVRSTARLDANAISGHATGIGFTASTGSQLTNNTLTRPSGGIGLSFDGVGSYDNQVNVSNTVDGTPVRWYTNVAGPVRLTGLRVEVPGITNVAQIMVYLSSNVTIDAPVARNGTAAGILLYGSPDANVSDATVDASATDGVQVTQSRNARVLGSNVTRSGGDGIRVLSSAGVLVENSRVENGRGRGVVIDTSDAPTLRGNAVTGNVGTGIHLDRVGPSAAIDNNVVAGNGAGIVAVASTVGSVRSNTLTSNTGDGIWLSSVPPGTEVEANNLTDHLRGVRLAASAGTRLASNVVVTRAGQTGFHFDDEASYNVTLPPSNTVNGVPVRWYVSATNVTVTGADVQVRGATNVAQVMVFRSANVTLEGPVAANGTDRGVFVFRSNNVTVRGANATNNSGAGLGLEDARDVRVENATSQRNGREGIAVKASAGFLAANVTLRDNLGAGAGLDASPAPGARLENLTVRSNARGLVVAGSQLARLNASTFAANGASALSLSGATVENVTNNTFDDHKHTVELTLTRGARFSNNTVTKLANQTAWHFADTASLDAHVGPSNVVNGVPMRWYSGVTGLELRNVTVELPGMTNVAQVMLYASPGATLEGLRIANGTANGLVVLDSGGTLVNGTTVSDNGGDGIQVEGGGAAVRNSTILRTGARALRLAAQDLSVVDNVTVDGAATGVHVVGGQVRITASAIERAGPAGHGVYVEAAQVNVSRSTLRSNAPASLALVRTTDAAVYDSLFEGSPTGLLLDSVTSPLKVGGNRFTNHTKAIELRASEFGEFRSNQVDLTAEGQTAFWFADERSYNNVIPTSNRVNGRPVHWYTTLAGAENDPIVLSDVRSELRGVTNVAQVMVYRSSYVRMPDAVATNGSARGLYLYRSSSVTMERANASGNALSGIELYATQSATVRDASAVGSATGVRLAESSNNVVSGVDARGASVGVLLADAGSRDNRVDRVTANGTARGIQDAAWTGTGLLGNNLLVDAGAAKRVKVGSAVGFNDTTVTYRIDSTRVMEQSFSFGDAAANASSAAAALFRPAHTYAVVGSYVATLTVSTADGQTLADNVTVEVVVPLSAPRDVSARPGARNVTLSWSAPASDGASAITAYRIYRAEPGGAFALVATTGGATFQHVDANLLNGRSYTYGVAAVNGDGEGPQAQIAATPVTVPSAPGSLAAAPLPGGASLSWSPPADAGGLPVGAYDVLRSVNGSAFATVATVGNATSTNVSGLTNGLTYSFAVRAANVVGVGPLSAPASVTPLGPPGAPREVRALGGDASARVVWVAPADDGGTPVTGYRVWRGTSNDSLMRAAETLAANVSSTRETGLSNGQRYVFAVSAVNAFGEGPTSAGVVVVPAAVDALEPIVFALQPADGALVGESPALVGASFADNDGVVLESVRFYVDGAQVGANVTAAGVEHVPSTPFTRGTHTLRVVLRDPSGNEADVSWSFRLLAHEERVPVFEWSNASLIAQRVAPGANATARVEVRNVGFAAGNATAVLRLGENALAVEEVLVEEGASRELLLAFEAPTVLGTYELTLGESRLELTVVQEPEANATEVPPAEAPPPVDEGPVRPARNATPPPRATPTLETPFPLAGAVVVAVAVALLSRRR